MSDRIIQRNDTAANWGTINPILAMGELGIVTDGAKGYKIGDGVTPWNDLPYPANPSNIVQTTGNSETAVMSQKCVSEKVAELSLQVTFDISECNKVDNEPKTYADSSEALTDVPAAKRHGGMSIKYIQSSDNKYVQYRFLLSGSFTNDQFTNISNWQNMNDVNLLFEDLGNLNIDKLKAFLKDIKIYYKSQIPPRLSVLQVRKNENGVYRIIIVEKGVQSPYYANITLTTPDSNIRYTKNDEVSIELFVDWSVLGDGQTNFQKPMGFVHNIISLNCYIHTPETNKDFLSSYTSSDLSDFVLDYYLPNSATEFSQENLIANINCCYKMFEIPTSTDDKYVNVYSGYADNYPYENIFFLDSEYQVIERKSILKAGVSYKIPTNAVYICVCFLKQYTPFGIQVFSIPVIIKATVPYIEDEVKAKVLEDIDNYLLITQSHQEVTARDACYEAERRNPFKWKTFTKKWFTFMNDDASQNMTQYYRVCRDRRVPYCHAFILNRYPTYSYTGNDADRTNLVKNPAVGQSYTVAKTASQTYLRLYFDRQYNLGFPVRITVDGTQYTISSPDDARIEIGNSTSVTFTIISIGELTTGRTKFINVIATADSTDSAFSTATWTVKDVLKNIVFDFGEILAHNGSVINMWDLQEVEKLLAKYLFDDPRKINELLEENHVKGAILPGGTNSNRGMNTDLGQHYCCRYILYCDYYGTSPQYMIQRKSFTQVIGDSSTVSYATAKANALDWISNQANGFYPLYTHSEKTPEEVAGVIDAVLESNDTICSNWRLAFENNS